MMTRLAPRALVVVVAALAGCGDFSDVDGEDDGEDPVTCPWPIDSAVPGGTVELGTGTGDFEPMPEQLQFIRGYQNGTYLVLHARIDGLVPGDPDELHDPRNPRTRFSGTMLDGTVVEARCPSTTGYVPSARDGSFERETPHALEFQPFDLAVPAFDTVVSLKVEVIDAEGRYASDERDVFCAAPDGWPYP